MGQINVYFPEDLEKEIRKRAEEENKSLSAVIIEVTRKEFKPVSYPRSFWKALEVAMPEDFEYERLGPETLTEKESF